MEGMADLLILWYMVNILVQLVNLVYSLNIQ